MHDARRARVHESLPPDGPFLEIGPLDTPMLDKARFQVFYLDYLPTAGLRSKYAADPAVDQDRIVEIDFISAGNIPAAIPRSLRFNGIVASHVVEHVPDLVAWLAQAREVLAPGGILSLVVPDKRYTFDRARAVSTIGEVLGASIERRARPGPVQIVQFFSSVVRFDLASAWAGTLGPHDLHPIHTLEQAIELGQAASAGAYIDVHCWIHTPRSFLVILQALARLGLAPFSLASFHDSARHDIEFSAALRRDDAPPETLAASYDAWIAELPADAPP